MTERLKYLRLCAWSGPAFLAIFIVFWGILGHNIPPLPADLPAQAIADHYRLNANEVRLGMGMSMSFAVLYMIWGLAIAKVMQYGVEKDNDVLSTIELWGAGLTVVPLLVSSSFWLAGAYRPEGLDDSVLQLFYDLPWLLIDVAYMVTSVQMFALGVAFLKDERAVPLVPKWLCWYGIWVGFMFVAEVLMPFFTSGPFARHGVLNFWIEFFIWFFWIVALSGYVLIAIGRLEAEARGIVVDARAPRLAPAGSVANA
ncbi:MAG: hypothetical protein HY749_07960 [Gammaproteobacteria bacterium]|nr:hypothetical protein [Gammaproteobacteria bacterium]MBI5619280.1 hypothetical protein [Gammaproteobacteria bacterium]